MPRIHPFSAVLGLTGVALGAATAQAQSAFDGLWSVQIVSQSGSCGQGSVSYPVRIAGGSVQNAGSMGGAIAGRVDGRGNVRVSVSGSGQQAYGSGRLTRSSGSGRWTSPTSGCAGYWRAARQG